jgi:hypothetical protein
MLDQTADRNKQLKATMRDENTGNLNTSGKDGVVVCSPMKEPNGRKLPTGHVEPGTGRKSYKWCATKLKENDYRRDPAGRILRHLRRKWRWQP